MIYFIKQGDFVKIGYSASPVQRIATLQTANPNTLEMLFCMPGDVSMEAAFHQVFFEYHHANEWYKLEGRLLEFVGISSSVFQKYTDGVMIRGVSDLPPEWEYWKGRVETIEKRVNSRIDGTGRDEIRDLVIELLNDMQDPSSYPNGAGFLTIGEVMAIIKLGELEFSRNAICDIVFGSKNSPRLAAVSGVLEKV